MLRSWLAAVLLLLSAGTAFAADAADRTLLGFSADGRWFAFEQYGVQDGSGFPYAELYVIDLDKDAWAAGTPVKALIQDEGSNVKTARDDIARRAAPFLEKLAIGHPGRLLAGNAVGEEVSDTTRMTFRSHHNTPEQTALRLEMIPLPATCPDPGEKPMGFVLSASRSQGPVRELYRDKAVPSSRGCPLEYRLADVVAFDTPAGVTRHVVLLHMLRFGFEGRDARFIAVPVTLP
ncbi:MAG: DUF2259 domain-containing protein [Parvibaculaceae bacterium]